MPITRISPKRQITIPKEAFEKLQLEVGDFLEADVTEEGLLLIPKKLISKDQIWFWTKEWQKKEREADEAIARGEISGPFKKHTRSPPVFPLGERAICFLLKSVSGSEKENE